jgi:hypothetical protein
MKSYIKTLLILFLLVILNGCKKNEIPDIPEQEAFFSYLADNFTVTFTNKSKLTGTLNWDFGDGGTSTEENPVHLFPGKGRYVVTLTVNAGGKLAEATTIMLLDKTSPVKMDDGTLADWAGITKNVVVSGPDGLAVKLGKFDYDANNIYIYIEQQSTIADQTIFSLFVDTDTLLSTGFQMGGFPGMGAEIYCEGQIPTTDYWFDPYEYIGDGSGWDWNYLQAGEFYKPGHFEESGGLLKYELALSRTKLKGLDGEAVRIVIVVMDSGWSDIGYMPDGGSSGFLLMMNQ